MLVKASIAAAAAICAVVSLHSINLRQVYNGMYPVNGLRRDVLNLCHQAQPTFVRAIRESRDNCYDSMPDPVELAIGWVRTSSRLAALRRPLTPVERAERLLVEAAVQGRFGLLGARRFREYETMPAADVRRCADPAMGLAATAPALPNDRAANDRLARQIAGGQETALAALGLPPRDARPGTARGLPVLPLATASGRRDRAPAAGLGDGSGLSLAPPAAPPGCRTPA